MDLPKREGLLQRQIRKAAEGHGFLLVCMALATAGTLSASYPVTAVIVPAALLLPDRWRQISLVTAIGSAIGATLLVIVFHHLRQGRKQGGRVSPPGPSAARYRELIGVADGPAYSDEDRLALRALLEGLAAKRLADESLPK